LQKQINYDLVFLDYEYCNEAQLKEYNSLSQKLIIITKSFYMKTIESLGLKIFKTIYEPLNNLKLKAVLENYQTENFNAQDSKQSTLRPFDADASNFDAKVLVAEDNIINQKLIKRTLEDLGLTISIASNGLEAFQKRKDGDFDLIFMDIQMPFLDGIEATKEILEFEEENHRIHVPIIALTANALKGDRERFLEAGLDEYTTKPLVRAEIVLLLNQFLSDKVVPIDENEVEVAKETLIEPEIVSKEDPILEDEIEAPETITSEETQIEKYHADILLAKKSHFETKLFEKVLKSLGYSYEIANSFTELESMVSDNNYRVVLFDKEIQNLHLETFSKLIKSIEKNTQLPTYLILMSDPASEENLDDVALVHETIKNLVNKDLLRLVIEKFI